MREKWYGDSRDLVKWGTLVVLAREHRLRTIIQIPFLRGGPDGDRPTLRSGTKTWPLPDEVWSHFRNVRAVARLGSRCGLTVRVCPYVFRHIRRDEYLRRVIGTLRGHRGRKAVLLDPDTGMEPSRLTAAHVGYGEISGVWQALSRGDWLVLYQHQRRKTGWLAEVKREFERACNTVAAHAFLSASAPDVAFLAAAKA